MAGKQGDTISVTFLVEKGKKVVYAEGKNHFVDILLGFLSLPMGTIIRLIRKQQPSDQQSQIGCLNNLYESVESLPTSLLWAKACKDMLLRPKNPFVMYCRNLKVKIDDTESKQFICSNWNCFEKAGLLSTYAGSVCRCGNSMSREICLSSPDSSAGTNTNGVFLKGVTSYIVSDNLNIRQNSPVAIVEVLADLGLNDVNDLEKRVVNLGSEQILKILEQCLISRTPLSDLCYPQSRLNKKRRQMDVSGEQMVSPTTPHGFYPSLQKVKILIGKSNKKVLCAEIEDNHVDLIFSILTFPLGSVLHLSGGLSSLGCVDNLYASVKCLGNKWFVIPKEPNNQSFQYLLLNPGLVLGFKCSSLPFQLQETALPPATYFWRQKQLTLIDPKLPIGASSFLEYVRRPAIFQVTDDLVAREAKSDISFLKGLDLTLHDIEEHVVSFDQKEALDLLKASLTTTSALTSVYGFLVKKESFTLKKAKKEI